MYQSFQNIIALALVSISALIMTPCQAQTLPELNNTDTTKISPISTEPSVGIDPTLQPQQSNLGNSPNNQPSILSENLTTSPTNTAVTTTQTTKPSIRIPIGSRIFAVPSMEQ